MKILKLIFTAYAFQLLIVVVHFLWFQEWHDSILLFSYPTEAHLITALVGLVYFGFYLLIKFKIIPKL